MFCTLLVLSCQNKKQDKDIEPFRSHPESIMELFPQPKVEIKTVGIYLYNGYSPLDAMGPYSVFTHIMGAKVFFIAKQKEIVEDGAGLKVMVDTSISEVKHLDILLIPGGLAQTYTETKDTSLLNWIRNIDRTSKYTTSVCTGAWVLGAAGLLKDKNATTHWFAKSILAKEFGANIENKRYTHSGKYWTAAGVSAGIDLSLALLNDIAGEHFTKATMLDMEYNPQPPFQGGSEGNSDKSMVEGLRAIYNEGVHPATHPNESLKNLHYDSPKDLVCGMSLGMGIGVTAYYKGKLYGFCSSTCKEAFLRNPESYTTK
ncbi:YHS domain-containing protein [Rhizosphaericola mali]|uniref:YHS domain-containing protein n=2 Tax=Rhizosphaericola mali TaxID=2545455 RepID=A0A5P2GGK5_9BACT|nr:YHS domain-containing protein [Rhizosphaericola mali]